VFAVVGPRDRSVIDGIARLSDRDYQMPLQRTLRRLVDSADERVEKIVLTLRRGLRGAGFYNRLLGNHRPAHWN
jgi:hypothetical protein